MGNCFFIGHRETPDRVYPTLLETIERHITEYGVSEFVVGQYGSFDRLVIRALSQAKRAHPDITLMLMTPYYPVNRKVDLPEAFDALFYPPDLETVPKRLAIVRANRYMVERSDFLIAYVRHPASNARELLDVADGLFCREIDGLFCRSSPDIIVRRRCVLSHKRRGWLQPSPSFRYSRNLALQDELYHPVINNGPAVLVCVDKRLGTGPVNQSRDAG